MKLYLLNLQFFGFRYHGWMLQPEVRTVQGQLEKTIRFLFPTTKFKTLASGRTDAMVSAQEIYIQLFFDGTLQSHDFVKEMNLNLPQDIRLIGIEEVDDTFNVIQDVKSKEYHYLFTDDQMHPFCSGMMTRFRNPLNFEIMQKAAAQFKGSHWFGNYCYRKGKNDEIEYTREIESSELVENDLYHANFFPERSYLYKIVGKGFMRYQVRLMVGALIRLGEGKWSWQDFEKSLQASEFTTENMIAPASGLILHKVNY